MQVDDTVLDRGTARPGSGKPMLSPSRIVIVGGLVAAGAVAGMLLAGGREAAEACQASQGMMRLSKTTADAGGAVRIRIGNDLSPAFTVADGPINLEMSRVVLPVHRSGQGPYFARAH
ncbi:hypothetical protein MKK69_23685 [Methylobacterium sp. J-026]|uniref:hypothetical protein n=1 Tax=Methylobacterium sp. J-026 TaxID=2836624 RepID=UPI001FBB2831|nr:hypothetical protein [Methylobacterium sp. J-026]MCJ2137009.1 hypothetical protein [Methylobacterium sp. J-026]